MSLANIKLLVLDVDGVLTDGTFVPSAEGDWKAFHVHDGLGIRMLQEANVEVALLSGRRSKIVEARGPRPLISYAQVQADHTADAIVEIRAEMRAIQDSRPIEAGELDRARRQQTLSLPGRWEGISDVGGAIVEMIRFGLPDDYWQQWVAAVMSVTIDDVTQAASVLRPDSTLWIVVGDRRQLEDPLQRLEMGPVRLLDSEGSPQV